MSLAFWRTHTSHWSVPWFHSHLAPTTATRHDWGRLVSRTPKRYLTPFVGFCQQPTPTSLTCVSCVQKLLDFIVISSRYIFLRAVSAARQSCWATFELPPSHQSAIQGCTAYRPALRRCPKWRTGRRGGAYSPASQELALMTLTAKITGRRQLNRHMVTTCEIPHSSSLRRNRQKTSGKSTCGYQM